jgi:CRP/FNR family transcriptional regulator, anaerobic regulatory protein
MNAASLKSELLELFPVFAAMPAAELDHILAVSSVRTVKAGTALFSSGSPCSGFPMLLSGTVRVTRINPQGREVQLYRVKPGESCIMSTGCLLGNIEYGATGIAEAEVKLVVLPPALFNQLMSGNVAFRHYVFALFSERLAGMMELVEAVTFQRLDRRLAALLLERGEVVHASQQKLADDIGTVREMVGRVLRNFEDRGLVALGREQVRVVDPAGLRAVLE